MKKLFLQNALLIAIVALGLLLRVLFLQASPPSLNVDEAALGYNAFSILTTGADEHGKFLPLTLESFGDWKLPGYVYADIIPVAIFGLSEFSTRLPSILAGVAGIILMYYIAQNLFKKKTVSLFTALFFAVSPWSIYFSRAAYEVNLATSVFLLGLYLFLRATKSKRPSFLLISSGILFGLTLFTYHAYILFAPLFAFFLVITTRQKLKKELFLFIIPFVVFCIVSGITNLQTSSSKLGTTTIFTNKNIIYNRVENFRKDTVSHPALFDKIHTKYVGVPYQVLENYFASFSPSFLFDRGGEKLVHNLDGFGNLYIFDALLLISGMAGLFFFREKSIPLLGAWLILAPISSALTLDAPNSTRLFLLMPLFAIVAGYGAWALLFMLHKTRWGKAIFSVLCVLFVVNVLFFLNLYFIHFGYSRARFWHYGYKEAVMLSQKYPDSNVVFRGPENFPYIYFLFYNSYNPKKFRSEVSYTPTTWDGFRYVTGFGKYSFVDDLDYPRLKKNTLYVNDKMYITENVFVHNFKRIRLPNGDPILGWYIKQ